MEIYFTRHFPLGEDSCSSISESLFRHR